MGIDQYVLAVEKVLAEKYDIWPYTAEVIVEKFCIAELLTEDPSRMKTTPEKQAEIIVKFLLGILEIMKDENIHYSQLDSL